MLEQCSSRTDLNLEKKCLEDDVIAMLRVCWVGPASLWSGWLVCMLLATTKPLQPVWSTVVTDPFQ